MNRTPSGQFVKGCQPGPGRPPRRTEQGYLLATMDACSLADWSEIVASAVESAKAGDSLRIPRQVGHRFHGKLDSDSSANWTPVPGQVGHLK